MWGLALTGREMKIPRSCGEMAWFNRDLESKSSMMSQNLHLFAAVLRVYIF
jgi:hypothetical protein